MKYLIIIMLFFITANAETDYKSLKVIEGKYYNAKELFTGVAVFNYTNVKDRQEVYKHHFEKGENHLTKLYIKIDGELQLRSMINKKNNKLNGPYLIFYPNGKLKRIANYKDGMRHGISMHYNEFTGDIEWTSIYENNQLINHKKFDKKGNQIEPKKKNLKKSTQEIEEDLFKEVKQETKDKLPAFDERDPK